ncbi:hypothetical protein EVAR_4626_1 [Eumeta japonica]|uniref:Uncharacterized protein n=1 Tax=Eumeta variegata TaxID=151549 RepID=A0A4C1SX39_EUMVA|nr:hypothetical protein EVAR_4626_1 [Eumeta japonica]
MAKTAPSSGPQQRGESRGVEEVLSFLRFVATPLYKISRRRMNKKYRFGENRYKRIYKGSDSSSHLRSPKNIALKPVSSGRNTHPEPFASGGSPAARARTPVFIIEIDFGTVPIDGCIYKVESNYFRDEIH